MASKRKHNKRRARKSPQTSPSRPSQQLPPGSSSTAPGSPDLNKNATPAVAQHTPKYTPAASIRTVPSSLDSTPLTHRSANLPSASASSTATAPHAHDGPAPTWSSSAASDNPDLPGSPTANKSSHEKSMSASQPDPPEPPPSRELIHPAKRTDPASKNSTDLAGSHGRDKGSGKAKKAHNKIQNISPQKPMSKPGEGHPKHARQGSDHNSHPAGRALDDPLESSVEVRDQIYLSEALPSAPLAVANAGLAQIASGRFHSVQPAQALLSLGQAAGVALEASQANENGLLEALKSHGSPGSQAQAAGKSIRPGQTGQSTDASANATAKSESSQTVASKRDSLLAEQSTDETERRASVILDKARCQSKDNSRRAMSGATDRFDFDAQQREQAGPGLGRVKKARHGSHVPTDQEQGAGRGEAEVGSETSEGPAVGAKAVGSQARASIGQRHAQVCLRSAIQTSSLSSGQAQQAQELEPSLVQIYLSYFDLDQDGSLDPLDTWRAIRRLGFGLIFSTFAALVGHAVMGLFGSNQGLSNMFLGRCRLPVGRGRLNGHLSHLVNVGSGGLFSNTSTSEDQSMDKVGPWAVWQKTCKHMGGVQMIDPINWLQFIVGWIVVVALTWPTDFTVKCEEIDGVYNGDLLFLIARNKNDSLTRQQELHDQQADESIVVVRCEKGELEEEKESNPGGDGGRMGTGVQKSHQQRMKVQVGNKESLEVRPSTLLATVL